MTGKLTPHEAATVAARARWAAHDTRVVRLSDLTPEQRRLVLALIAAARENAKTAPAIVTPEAAQEHAGGSRRPIAA